MVYGIWSWFIGLFLMRRCTVTLANGAVVKWVRPRKTSLQDYRTVFDGWRAASDKRIKLDSGNAQLVISASSIISVEIR
jgi:hypothetical protein